MAQSKKRVLLQKASHFWRQYKREKMAMFGLAVVLGTLFAAGFAEYIAPQNPDRTSPDRFENPSLKHFLGTDALGRDILSRLLFGSRVALSFAFGAAALSLLVGVVIGALAGYYGGWIDDILSRIVEVFLMLPQIFLVIVVVSVFGNNIFFGIVVIGLTIWPSNARIARAQVISLRERPFVQAAIASGAGDFRVLWRHILPNSIYPIIANSTLQMGHAIIIESSLSFLGLGDPTANSWGQMLRIAQYHMQSGPWEAIFPGLAIFILILGLNLVGDGVNYALNPKLREREGW